MKKLNLIILFVSIIFCSCGNDPIKNLKSIDEAYPIIFKINGAFDTQYRNIRIYVIDSCEYIGNVSICSSDFLTHKGNCKFCAERNKK